MKEELVLEKARVAVEFFGGENEPKARVTTTIISDKLSKAKSQTQVYSLEEFLKTDTGAQIGNQLKILISNRNEKLKLSSKYEQTSVYEILKTLFCAEDTPDPDVAVKGKETIRIEDLNDHLSASPDSRHIKVLSIVSVDDNEYKSTDFLNSLAGRNK